MKVKFLFAVATLLLSWGSVQSPRPIDDVELFADDFSRFPPGRAVGAGRPVERRDPGVPLPRASRRAHASRGATRSCTSTRGPPATKADEPYLEQHLINDGPAGSRRCS